MQPGHPDVHDQFGGAAEVPGGEQGLAGDGMVGGAGGDHDDPAADGLRRVGRPGQQPAVGVVRGVGKLREHGGGVLGGGPGEQRARPVLAHGGRDQPDLLGGLARAVDGLRVAAAAGPVEVEVGEPGQHLLRLRRRQSRPTVTSGRVNAPDWIPARSTATNRKPAATTARCTCSRTSAHARARSATGSSTRATSPWWRTRQSVNPSARRARSAASTWASFSGVTGSWCGIRDARQGAAGLSAQGRPEHPRDPPDGGLVEPGVGERPQHAVLGRGPRAGPVGPAHVVGVLPVGDPVEPVPVEHLVADGREQLVLAVEAAVGPVRAVLGPVPLAGLDLDDGHADEPGDLVRRGALVGGEAGRHPEEGDDRPGPSARTASASSVAESTPPENATPSRPTPASCRVTRSTAAWSAPKVISARIVLPSVRTVAPDNVSRPPCATAAAARTRRPWGCGRG